MPGFRLTIAAVLAALPAYAVWPQAEDQAYEPAEVTIGQRGSEQDPLAGRDQGLAVEPVQGSAVAPARGVLGVPSMRVTVDPRVLGVAPGEPLPPLRREGETLRKRDGQLLPTGERGYAVFILEADPDAGDEKPLAMVVAPCMTLESMERLLEDRGEGLRFTVTGQVHTYRGVNYLLPTSSPKPWLIDTEAPDQLVTQPDETQSEGVAPEPGGEPDAADEPKDGEAPPADTNEAEATPSADEVLRQLLEQTRDTPTPDPASTDDPDGQVDALDTPALPKAKVASDPLLLGLDNDQPMAELKDEGQFIVARTGRLIRSADGSQALFVLDADGPGAAEAPMIMQACKLLETMEKTVKEQGDNVPFVVTGQVFLYRGANYLLPTIVKREFDRGNLE